MLQNLEPVVSKKQDTRKTILIVEDDQDQGELLNLIIEEESSYHPVLVTTSDCALKVIQHTKPDLLLLDYTLTPLNGLELYDHLHTMQGLEAVPAIILTASLEKHQPEIVQRCLVGIAKPYELDTLLQTIEHALA